MFLILRGDKTRFEIESDVVFGMRVQRKKIHMFQVPEPASKPDLDPWPPTSRPWRAPIALGEISSTTRSFLVHKPSEGSSEHKPFKVANAARGHRSHGVRGFRIDRRTFVLSLVDLTGQGKELGAK